MTWKTKSFIIIITKEPLYSSWFAKAVAAICRLCKNGIVYGTGAADEWRFSVDYDPAMEVVINGHFLDLPNRCDPDYHVGRDIFQGVLFTDLERALTLYQPVLRLCEIVQGLLIGGKIGPQVDFIRKDLTKADGIREVLERMNIAVEDCYAIGDGSNDITMLEFAGVGVAMGNASDEVKKHADYITLNMNEDGVEVALQHFGLI